MNELNSFNSIKERIDLSNSIASKNKNFYPIQEQATLLEIWERVAPLNSSTNHIGKVDSIYVLKKNLVFEDILIAYLRMFTNKNNHSKIIGLLNQYLKSVPELPPRIVGAYTWLKYLKDNWTRLYSIAANWRHTLFCEKFVPLEIIATKEWDFDISDSVYRSKLWSILFPDICIPFDNASRKKILKDLRGSGKSYRNMLLHLRSNAIDVIVKESSNLAEFRKLDNPQNGCPFQASLISLPREGFNYGNSYKPEERPISRIIDKMYYSPRGNTRSTSNKSSNSMSNKNSEKLHLSSSRNKPLRQGSTSTLSGRGQQVDWEIDENNTIKIRWGTSLLSLTEQQRNIILNEFFISDEWYPLGADMTNPLTGGLGEFIKKEFELLPRYASAIAAIFVDLDIVSFRQGSPILLKRR